MLERRRLDGDISCYAERAATSECELDRWCCSLQSAILPQTLCVVAIPSYVSISPVSFPLYQSTRSQVHEWHCPGNKDIVFHSNAKRAKQLCSFFSSHNNRELLALNL